MPPSITPEPQSHSADGVSPTSRRSRMDSAMSPITKPTTLEKRAATAPEFSKDLATTFKTDLCSIRNLVTCSICDQLLYEPFTIQCGHTYCYSCLCSWFIPNKKKKTCPECRTVIKQMPAPSFMVKQMVEIFVKRVELMPPDESVDQHTSKRAEEIAAVEQDRSSQQGLFKGLFPARRPEPIMDEADGVQRCPHCNTEYLGGPSCMACGGQIEDDGFDYSGDDLDELEALEDDFQDEIENDIADMGGLHSAFVRRLFYDHVRHHHHHHHNPRHVPRTGRHTDTSSSTPSSAADSQESEHSESQSESEDSGSMQDFIVNDSSPIGHHHNPDRRRAQEAAASANSPQSRHPVVLSDDDSDEGGPIVRSRRRGHRLSRSTIPPRVPVVDLTDDDDEEDVSDNGEAPNVAERLRYDGWSPLHESENDDQSGGETTDVSDATNGIDNSTDEESDTETMLGNDDDRAVTYRWQQRGPRRIPLDSFEPNESDNELSSNVDGDGDTDMSVSPVHGFRGDYGQYPESESSQDSRGDMDEYGEMYDADIYNGNSTEQNLGYGHDLHELDGDVSDDYTPQPPRRRFRLNHEDNYDPRISRILARHQTMREGSEEAPISLDLQELNAAEESPESDALETNRANSHSRGRASSSRYPRLSLNHRLPPTAQATTRRRAASPSVTRVISSSSRPSRVARQYHHERSGPRISAYWP